MFYRNCCKLSECIMTVISHHTKQTVLFWGFCSLSSQLPFHALRHSMNIKHGNMFTVNISCTGEFGPKPFC